MDSNDIIFSERSIDFFAVGEAIFRALSGGGSAEGGGAGTGFDTGPTFFESLVSFLSISWNVFTVLSFLLSALLFYGIIYAYIRDEQLAHLENEEIANQERLWQQLYGSHTTNDRWADVEAHIEADSPSDWKLAIIEADIMLEEMLESAGFAGTTVGERLKSANPANFQTLSQAWDAHLVRNKIAHQGADFVLTHKIARETITQFRMVFTEFGVI